MTYVALTYPHTHTVSHTFMASVTGAVRRGTIGGPVITDVLAERCYPGDDLAQGRNRAVQRFLATEAEWLWTVDTDMGFPPDTLDRLLSTAEETSGRVVSVLYNIVVEEGRTPYGIPARAHTQPMAGVWNKPADGTAWAVHPKAVQAVDAVGAGCLLVHRSVFEDMYADGAWWSIRPGMGEDFSFCQRLGEAGIPIWVDPNIPVVHHKSCWV